MGKGNRPIRRCLKRKRMKEVQYMDEQCMIEQLVWNQLEEDSHSKSVPRAMMEEEQVSDSLVEELEEDSNEVVNEKSFVSYLHRCPYKHCSFTTMKENIYKKHIEEHRRKLRYKCTYPGCDYAATTSGHLQTHIKTHTGEKPYKCTYPGCDYATTVSSALKAHIRTHTGE